MEQALKAMAEPKRRQILELVADQELTAGEISEHFEVTRPAISQHLTILKDARLIEERRDGTRRLYKTRQQGFAEARLFLEGFWDDRLGYLKRAAERDQALNGITEHLSVRRETFIAASQERIWEYLADEEKTTRWMGTSAAFDFAPGGRYEIEVVPGETAAGEFIVIDPPHRLAYTWGWRGEAASVVPEGTTIVVFELVPSGSGTLLRITHHDLPEIGSTRSHSRGWGHYLERLTTTATGGSPGPDPWATDSKLRTAELRS